jgi:two-component system sensor histidine kinase/response regulator
MPKIEQREIVALAELAFHDHQRAICCRTDRLFAWLMIVQWIAGIAGVLWLLPLAGQSDFNHSQVDVWAAFFLGGLITAFPVFLAFYIPGAVVTRHVIAVAQMLMSGLLIHLSGGRAETHFHVFGSLALMAFYRDWRVLVTAATVIFVDHVLRGFYWPQSVYGVSAATPWRAVEHAGWVAFVVAVLSVAIRQSRADMKEIALRQATLEVTNAHIEDKVQQRTAELKETIEQLETFCHSVSHDLRAPLRTMQGFAHILAKDYSGSLDQFGRECAQKIAFSSQRLDSLMTDLLEYTRVSRVQMNLESVPVGEAVEEVITLLAEDIRTKHAGIVTANELATVRAHKSTLIQVLLNLISNALKFVKPGEDPRIQIRSEEVDGRVRLFVEDNGIGIDPKNFGKLFGMFQRLNTAQEYPGTGIGLAIVRKAVERMGGTVNVESEAGKGSRFWVELPAGRAAVAAAP